MTTSDVAENVTADLIDFFRELDDSDFAPFGEMPSVSGRTFHGDESVSFVVSGNERAVRITVTPISPEATS